MRAATAVPTSGVANSSPAARLATGRRLDARNAALSAANLPGTPPSTGSHGTMQNRATGT